MSISYAGRDLAPLQARAVRALERLTRGSTIDAAHRRFEADSGDTDTFFRRAAAALQVSPMLRPPAHASVPTSGGLLVIANHPYGVVDGLAIAADLERLRADVRIVVWDSISLPPSPTHFFPLDLSETGVRALRQNVAVRPSAIDYLAGGGCVLLFPSGSAELTRHPLGRPHEAPWTPLAVNLALKSGATVLPVFIEGHNSRLFHAASHLGDLVRRSLFLAETRRLIGTSVTGRIGAPIPPIDLQRLHRRLGGCDRRLATHLRAATLQLGRQRPAEDVPTPAVAPAPMPRAVTEPRLAPPTVHGGIAGPRIIELSRGTRSVRDSTDHPDRLHARSVRHSHRPRRARQRLAACRLQQRRR